EGGRRGGVAEGGDAGRHGAADRPGAGRGRGAGGADVGGRLNGATVPREARRQGACPDGAGGGSPPGRGDPPGAGTPAAPGPPAGPANEWLAYGVDCPVTVPLRWLHGLGWQPAEPA